MWHSPQAAASPAALDNLYSSNKLNTYLCTYAKTVVFMWFCLVYQFLPTHGNLKIQLFVFIFSFCCSVLQHRMFTECALCQIPVYKMPCRNMTTHIKLDDESRESWINENSSTPFLLIKMHVLIKHFNLRSASLRIQASGKFLAFGFFASWMSNHAQAHASTLQAKLNALAHIHTHRGTTDDYMPFAHHSKRQCMNTVCYLY